MMTILVYSRIPVVKTASGTDMLVMMIRDTASRGALAFGVTPSGGGAA